MKASFNANTNLYIYNITKSQKHTLMMLMMMFIGVKIS